MGRRPSPQERAAVSPQEKPSSIRSPKQSSVSPDSPPTSQRKTASPKKNRVGFNFLGGKNKGSKMSGSPGRLSPDKMDPVIEEVPLNDVEGAAPRLKSCMSVTNLQDSLKSASIDRTVSAPNLAAMGAPMKRSVSFHKIEIREYQRTLGDNPSVRSGPPIALDWNYNPDHEVFDVEEYEESKPRRSRNEMLMPSEVREVILKEYWDVSRGQMNEVNREVNITRRHRRATAMSTEAIERRHELLETASRRVKRLVCGGKKKEERKLWKNAKAASKKRVMSMNDLYSVGLDDSSSLSKPPSDVPHVAQGLVVSLSTGHDLVSAAPMEANLPGWSTNDADSDDEWGFGFVDEDDGHV